MQEGYTVEALLPPDETPPFITYRITRSSFTHYIKISRLLYNRFTDEELNNWCIRKASEAYEASQRRNTQEEPTDELWGDIVTPERAEKGDLDLVKSEGNGKIRYARVMDYSAMGYLVRGQVLDQTHAYYAMIFSDMKAAFLRRMMHKINSFYDTECRLFGDMGAGIFESMYPRVCRALPPRAEGLIVYSLSTQIPAELWDSKTLSQHPAMLDNLNRLLFMKQPGKNAPIAPADYQQAYESLVTAIDHVRDSTCNVCGSYEKPCAHR